MITNDDRRLFDGSQGLIPASGRRHGGRLLLLASLAAFGFGCSADGGAAQDQGDAAGEIGMNLRLSDGVSIGEVTYGLSGGPTALTGVIDVGASATISATLGPLAAGSNYSLTLTATTSAGARCTGSAGPFAVAANRTTRVSVVLTCASVHDRGTIEVSGTISVCPVIAALTAAPSEVYVGSDVHLTALAGPDDTAHGYPLAYSWDGTSSSDAIGNAVFHCATPGAYTVGLTVGNGNPACNTVPPDPATMSSITVTCTDPSGGP